MYNLRETPNVIVNVESLSTTPVTIYPAGTYIRAGHFIVASIGASARVVIFRHEGGGTEYMRVAVTAGDSIIVPGFIVDVGGLEVLTAAVATDVNVAAFNYLPGR